MNLTGGKSREGAPEAHVSLMSPRVHENVFEVSEPTPALPQPPHDFGVLGRQTSLC